MSNKIYVIGDSTTEMTIGFAQSKIKAQQERIQELEKAEKKAFWWSAEFTHIVHDGKVQKAWEDHKLLASKGEGASDE